MCLDYNQEATNEVKLELAKKGRIPLLKKYYVVKKYNTFKLEPPFRGSSGKELINKDGFIASDRLTASILSCEIYTYGDPYRGYSSEIKIEHGIHCHNFSNGISSSQDVIYVKAWGYKEDFVGCNSSKTHLVFTKIKVDKNNITKQVINNINKNNKYILELEIKEQAHLISKEKKDINSFKNHNKELLKEIESNKKYIEKREKHIEKLNNKLKNINDKKNSNKYLVKSLKFINK